MDVVNNICHLAVVRPRPRTNRAILELTTIDEHLSRFSSHRTLKPTYKTGLHPSLVFFGSKVRIS